jgi:aspartyl-tRNA(Asn)/glutamyl-tRNA(Gln) amidotransferase subunit A
VTLKDYQSYSEIKNDLTLGSISCVQLLDHYVQKISQSKTNAFLEVFHDSALQQALAVDKKIQSKSAGKLAGMVIGIKDNISYKGHKVSGSSKILSGYTSIYNATVIERLLNEGAIIIGRLNCDEFAMGGSNENSAFGNVLNPIQLDKVPGGSSGGSAAAVREGLCIATLGSDTGGSIRQPASFCGIVGYKPTYGRVSRYGLLAYASSFDQIGPLTHTVEDAALITQVMAGIDEYDSTLSTRPVENLVEATHKTPTKKKFAVLKECLYSTGLDSEIKTRMLAIIEGLKAEGHVVEEISFPFLEYLVPNYYVLTTAEASSNLSRYDGIHFGYRSPNAVDIESTYLKSRSEGFGPEVKRRIMLGTFVLSAGYFDAYYTKALKVRNLIKQKTEEIFKVFDFMLLPTTPTTAFNIGENTKDPITMYLQDIFTVHANLAGIPAISLPLGNHSNELPFGVQLMSKRFSDAELLEFSNHLMKKFGM